MRAGRFALFCGSTPGMMRLRENFRKGVYFYVYKTSVPPDPCRLPRRSLPQGPRPGRHRHALGGGHGAHGPGLPHPLPHPALREDGLLRAPRPAGGLRPGSGQRRGGVPGEEPGEPDHELHPGGGRAVQLPAGHLLRGPGGADLQAQEDPVRGPRRLPDRRGGDGRLQRPHQLLHLLPLLHHLHAPGHHHRHVSGPHPLGGRPAGVPRDLQRPLHPPQGPAGHGSGVPHL